MPLISEFPYSRYITSNFSDVSTPFFIVLLRCSRRFDLLLHLYGGTSQHTRFPILFPKIKFSNFLGPFPGAPGAIAYHFRIPLLPLHKLKFFRRFYPFFHGPTLALPTFRLTFTFIRRHLTTHTLSYTFPKIKFLKNFLGPFPVPRGFYPPFSNSPTPATYPHIFSHLSTSNCATIYTNLHDGTKDASQPTHFPILFSKNKFSKTFLGPFPGSQGLLSIIFEFPYSPTYPQIFSRLSTSILTSDFTVLPNGLTPPSYVLLALHPGVPNLWAQAIHGPRSPLDALEPNLHRHPHATTLLLL